MDETKYLILAHGENKTKDIRSCVYNPQTGKFDVTFMNGKTYCYGYNSIQRRSNPRILDPSLYQIRHNGKHFFNICGIYVFDLYDGFWHIVFSNGHSVTYQERELEISVSCLQESLSRDCLSYLRTLAEINELKGDDGEALLKKQYEKLILVTSGTEQPQDSNIQDLIAYIQYNNFEVKESKIYSVFDLLYQQYTAQRLAFLAMHKRVSAYDSENLMYGALEDLLHTHPGTALAVATHVSVRLMIRDFELLTEEDQKYVCNSNTHVDFLIYNRISKVPVLAIEVDGFHYHKAGTPQAERDKRKDSIFKRYGIPLLRCPTNGSGEMERIAQMLFTSTP